MTPIKFNNYLSKLGDKHNFSEEAVASGIGTRVGDAPEVEDFTGFYAEDAPDMGADHLELQQMKILTKSWSNSHFKCISNSKRSCIS